MEQILKKLYNIAEEKNIEIKYANMNKDGFAIRIDNDYLIALALRLKDDLSLRNALAEELGHCISNAFYLLESIYLDPRVKKLNIDKAETEAKNWKIENIIEIDNLINSLRENQGDLYRVSEDFNVTLDDLNYAIDLYTRKGLLPINQMDLFNNI